MQGKTAELRKPTRVCEKPPPPADGEGGLTGPVPRGPERGPKLLRVKRHCHSRSDLIAGAEAMEGVDASMSENATADRIRAHGLRPPNRMLLCGPQSTRRTLTAQIISSSLGCLFAYVAFVSLVSSYLGSTASNMRRVFDYMGEQRMVVLFDEFDCIGKRRDDPYEHGELKRAVNSFMQMLDEYKGGTVIMAATNHHGMLDDVLCLGLPDQARRALLFEKCLGALGRDSGINVGRLAAATRGHSAADIMQVCVASLRKGIVGGGDAASGGDVARSPAEQKRRKKMRGT